MPKVDVGVVTWNTAELTVAALRHTIDEDHGVDLRVLVHDNASSDSTVEALAELVPEAEVESSSENLGFAAGMNRLIARSEAPWFLALNSDARPAKGTIGTLVDAGQSHPRAAAVAPLLLRPDGTTESSTHPFPTVEIGVIDALGGRRWMPRRRLEELCLEGAWAHDRPRDVDWAVGAALLMRRGALDQLGGFDERFFMYAEDLEWCWRAHKSGWEIRFEPAAVVEHIGNVSGKKRWGDRRAALEAANLRVLLPEIMGPRRAAVYRGLQSVACAERLALSGLLRHREEAASWWLQLKAHLGTEAPPVGGTAAATCADGAS